MNKKLLSTSVIPPSLETRSRIKRAFLIATGCILVLFAMALRGHPQEPTPPAVLRVESQLVTLDVVVTDTKGNIVKNLDRGDFSIYENGVEQEIRTFDAPQILNPLPERPPKDNSGRDDWGDAPLTMLVIDALDTPFTDLAYSRFQVDKYLKAQPVLLKQPTILLWLNDSGFRALTSFTRDRDALISTVDSHRGELPNKLERGAGVEQLSSALSALQQMALFSRGNKGSKEIVWVGRSFPGVNGLLLGKAQLDLLHNAVSSTINLLLKSRATVYVVDPTLDLNPPTDRISYVAAPNMVTPFSSSDPFENSFSFQSFVEQTGGKYFYGRNDLNNEIASSIERETSFYSLSYVPSEPIRDGKYRRIDVRLRDPNLKAQTKHGYYPSSPSRDSPTPNDLKFDLHEAVVTGMDYNGVGLRLVGCQLEATRILTTCTVLVDDDSLTLSPASDGSKHTSIVAIISALDHKSVLLANRVFDLGLMVPTQPRGNSFTRLQLQLALPQKTEAVRLVVRDISGRIGTVNLDPTKVSQLVSAAAIPKKR
jgi:VWFA-related protein